MKRINTFKIVILFLGLLILPSSHAQEEIKIITSDGDAGDYFGISVCKSGDYIISGAIGDDDYANPSGAAYIYYYDGLDWIEQDKVYASDPEGGDLYGDSCAVKGDYAVVGAEQHNFGAAYVYHRNGAVWEFQQKLTASDGWSSDRFGSSVAIDGDTLVVGATAIGPNIQGAAYVFIRTGSTWTEQAKLTASDAEEWDMFGYSVSIEGDTIAIGARPLGASTRIGSAYIFQRSGSIWTEEDILMASDGQQGDYFGESISLSGDTVFVGANYRNSTTGSVYVFQKFGINWLEMQILDPSPPVANGQFGKSVFVVGDDAMIGAPNTQAGYIFENTGTWTQQDILIPSDAVPGEDIGWSVSIEGNVAVLSSHQDDNSNGSNAGSIYVYYVIPRTPTPFATDTPLNTPMPTNTPVDTFTPTFTPTPTNTPFDTFTPTFTPTPTCPPLDMWHNPGSTNTCTGDTQRDPLDPMDPFAPVCIRIWAWDTVFVSPVSLHYRVNVGSWQTHGFEYECFISMGQNHWWTYCDNSSNWWVPGGSYGDTVSYYIEVSGYGCTEYVHDSGQTPNESVAQGDPFMFTYPGLPTSTPDPGTQTPTETPEMQPIPTTSPTGLGYLLAAMSLLLGFVLKRRGD